MNNKVVLGMSGGVDSSVAAHLLLEAGYEVTGVTFRFWTECEARTAAARRTCCSLADLRDAERMAARLGVEHLTVDMRREFHDLIVEPFIDAYLSGSTPNPCVECNRLLKFPGLVNTANRLGAGHIATGHYARIAKEDGRNRLLRATDLAKDQSYVLYRLDQVILDRVLFPVGAMRKSEVMETARRLEVAAARKEESQDICFLPDGDYRGFLRERRPDAFLPGPIIDRRGKVLGQHRGIADYTIGQRRGLGIAAAQPYYVVELDPVRNAVIVGAREEAEITVVLAERASWTAGSPPTDGLEVTAKVRYQMDAVPGRIAAGGEDSFRVELDESVPAAAPGQSIVVYEGEEVLGGGIILSGSSHPQRGVPPGGGQ